MRNVLIIGGSRGIGEAIVRRFAQAGDKVFFTYLHSEEAAKTLADETGATALWADASSGTDTERVVKTVLEQDGRIDVLICSAGVSLTRMLADTTDEDYNRVMNTNVYGAFASIRAALREMFWQRRGCILTISSIWGQSGASCEAVYSASKAAVIALTQATAKEAASSGIRVNCIAPGLIDTAMNDHLTASEKRKLEEEIPAGRMGTPGEVAETAFFLCSDAAGYITGQVVSVNGGWRT